VLWDCAASRAHIPASDQMRGDPNQHTATRNYFKEHTEIVQPFVEDWNCIDGEDRSDLAAPDIKIVHYSDESRQPHLRHAIPRLRARNQKHWFDGVIKPHWRDDVVALFDREFASAIAAGYTPERYEAPPFGPIRIKSHRNYTGHDWSR
jgi:hypothetical protein